MKRIRIAFTAVLLLALLAGPAAGAYIVFDSWTWLETTGDVTNSIEQGDGDTLYTAGNFQGVREINLSDGTTVEVYGNITSNRNIYVDNGNLYLASSNNNEYQQIATATNTTVQTWPLTQDNLNHITAVNGVAYGAEVDQQPVTGYIYRLNANGSKTVEVNRTFAITSTENIDGRLTYASLGTDGTDTLYKYSFVNGTSNVVYVGITDRIYREGPDPNTVLLSDDNQIVYVHLNGTVIQTYSAPNAPNAYRPRYIGGYVYAFTDNSTSGVREITRWHIDNATVADQYRTDMDTPFSYNILQGDFFLGNGSSIGRVGNGSVAPTPTPTATPEPTGLELDIDKWQAPNSSQPYRVLLTNASGEFDVTDAATVTSDNTTVLTVNTTAQVLEGFDGNGTANVTAEYQGENVTVQVTVAVRSLDNIGIMPPEQWPCSFLGCDETTGGYNIGSSMQMLWLLIFIMVAGTQMIENPWAGVGAGVVTSVLFWVLEFIDLGTMLTIVFAGILVGLLMARTSMGRGVTRDNEYSGGATRRGE